MTRDALSPVHPLVIGRGDSMSTAKEGTLKVMETNALAASDWSVADAAHGPLGQVTARTPVVVLTASPCELESVATFSAAAPDLWADMLLSEGVDLSTVGIGHMDTQLSIDYVRSVNDKGGAAHAARARSYRGAVRPDARLQPCAPPGPRLKPALRLKAISTMNVRSVGRKGIPCTAFFGFRAYLRAYSIEGPHSIPDKAHCLAAHCSSSAVRSNQLGRVLASEAEPASLPLPHWVGLYAPATPPSLSFAG
jgi:hypothetical protein